MEQEADERGLGRTFQLARCPQGDDARILLFLACQDSLNTAAKKSVSVDHHSTKVRDTDR